MNNYQIAIWWDGPQTILDVRFTHLWVTKANYTVIKFWNHTDWDAAIWRLFYKAGILTPT